MGYFYFIWEIRCALRHITFGDMRAEVEEERDSVH